MKFILKPTLLIITLLFTACASTPQQQPTLTADAANPQHAECLVCKHNADLACVDLVVDKDTPRYTYNNTTYYFCSDQCKADFIKNPEKYIKNK